MQLHSLVRRLVGRGSGSPKRSRAAKRHAVLSKAAMQALDPRVLFSVQLNSGSSTLPQPSQLVEAHTIDLGDDFIVPDTINIDLYFTTDSPSRQHRILINDGKGSIHDSGIISGSNLHGPLF